MRHDHIGGITFTGSYAVGMHILRTQAARTYPRPCIAEMGGKNAAIVTARADLDVAAQGIVRSAFGMSGQKCSALSRVYVDRRVADALIEKLQAAVAKLATPSKSRPLRRSTACNSLNSSQMPAHTEETSEK